MAGVSRENFSMYNYYVSIMPEVSRFYGIKIRMFFDEQYGPHFHARYGGSIAQVSIVTLTILRGKLAPNAERLVLQWAQQNQRDCLKIGNVRAVVKSLFGFRVWMNRELPC